MSQDGIVRVVGLKPWYSGDAPLHCSIKQAACSLKQRLNAHWAGRGVRERELQEMLLGFGQEMLPQDQRWGLWEWASRPFRRERFTIPYGRAPTKLVWSIFKYCKTAVAYLFSRLNRKKKAFSSQMVWLIPA